MTLRTVPCGVDGDRHGPAGVVGDVLGAERSQVGEVEAGFLGEFAPHRVFQGGVLGLSAAAQQGPHARLPDLAGEVVAQVEQVLAAVVVDQGGGVGRLWFRLQGELEQLFTERGRGHPVHGPPLNAADLLLLQHHRHLGRGVQTEEEPEVEVLVSGFAFARAGVNVVHVDVEWRGFVARPRRDGPGRDPGLLVQLP